VPPVQQAICLPVTSAHAPQVTQAPLAPRQNVIFSRVRMVVLAPQTAQLSVTAANVHLDFPVLFVR